MEHVLVFIDEVEEIAADRQEARADVGVVNELLKSIVAFRERPQRLLVCATNNIASLDGAFLRHGRFDYVIPIGPPDAQARSALWHRATSEQATLDIDIDALVAASAGLTPADIGHATQLVAQYTFEASIESGTRVRPTTGAYLDALAQTRPTLDSTDIAAFTQDIERFQRS
jgi:SpoVK/Ycf46/Vps4 family AAA+-type ATPase